MTTFIAAVAGLILGSFLSVLLMRWPVSSAGGPHWQGVVAGRSRCARCSHVLAWYDLIPLVSWMWLRGACRYCRGRIGVLYPVLELTMAAVLGVYAYRFGIGSIWSVSDMAILFGLAALLFFDVRYQLLPDAITVPLAIVVAAVAFGQRPEMLGGMVMTSASLAAVILALHLVSHGRWIGLGDAKLAFVIGLLFGYPVALTVTVVAVWLGALIGVGLILLRKATLQTAVPFGAFWVAVAIVAMLIR